MWFYVNEKWSEYVFFFLYNKRQKMKTKKQKKKIALIFYLIEFEVDWPERPYNHPRRLCQRGRCRPALSTFLVFVSSFACRSLQHACLTEWKTSTTDFALQAGRQAGLMVDLFIHCADNSWPKRLSAE